MRIFILVPFYFFAALTTLFLLILISRALRAKVAANVLVIAAVLFGIGLVTVPLGVGWADLADYTGLRMVGLIVGSLILAGIDALFAPALPLPLDHDLREL